METAKIVFEKSKEQIKKGNKFFHKIDFIKNIHGINVIAYIIVSLEDIIFSMVLESNYVHKLFEYKFELRTFSIGSFQVFGNLIKGILQNISFDHTLGVFISNPNPNSSPKSKYIPLFYDVFGLDYIEKNNCIGCGKNTVLRTDCKHYCCLHCFEDKFKNNSCPSCNKKISNLYNQLNYYTFGTDELKFIKKLNLPTKTMGRKYIDLDDGDNDYDSETDDYDDEDEDEDEEELWENDDYDSEDDENNN